MSGYGSGFLLVFCPENAAAPRKQLRAARKKEKLYEQIDFFSDYKKKEEEVKNEKIEKNLQRAMIDIKDKYGKNAILKGMNLQEAGTTIDRNKQIGGHRS